MNIGIIALIILGILISLITIIIFFNKFKDKLSKNNKTEILVRKYLESDLNEKKEEIKSILNKRYPGNKKKNK